MNTARPYTVLILCTGNSARSILGEALINKWGAGKLVGYSAGSQPKVKVNPFAIELLKEYGFSTDNFRSKSWDEFAQPGAPPLDFVFTVCDNAAGEVCPLWPGQPITAHWGIEDPAAVEGSDDDKRRAFKKAYQELEARIKLFASLSMPSLDHARIKKEVDEIGKIGGK